MEVKITGFEEESVTRQVAAMVREQIGDRLDDAINTAIHEKLDEALGLIVAEKLRPAVEAALAEGWQRTNQWGDPLTGERIGLKERIVELLEKGCDRYNPKESRVDNIAKDLLDKAIKQELGEELKRAAAAFREQVDGVLQAKLRQLLAGALGLGEAGR